MPEHFSLSSLWYMTPHDSEGSERSFLFPNVSCFEKCYINTNSRWVGFICITFPQLQSLYGIYDAYYGESGLLTVVNHNIKGFCWESNANAQNPQMFFVDHILSEFNKAAAEMCKI